MKIPSPTPKNDSGIHKQIQRIPAPGGCGVLLYCRGHHKQNNRNNSSPNFLVGDGQPPDLCIIIPVRSPSCLPSALMVFHLCFTSIRGGSGSFLSASLKMTKQNLQEISSRHTILNHPGLLAHEPTFHTYFTPISHPFPTSLYIYI